MYVTMYYYNYEIKFCELNAPTFLIKNKKGK